MPSKSRQELINDVANKIFDEMVQEIQFDTVLRARLDAQKAQRQCSRCGTHCLLSHPPGTSTTPQLTNSQPASSQTNGTAPKSISGPVGTATPTKDNPNIYLSCPVCKRSFASNRCAAHLATCMGISTGSRRGARNVKSKADERAASPYVDLPDDATLSGSQKSKSKKKDSNGNGKRPSSPSILDTPTKKSKKQSTAGDIAEIASLVPSQVSSIQRQSSITSSGGNNNASPSPSAYSSPTTASSTDSEGSKALAQIKGPITSIPTPAPPSAKPKPKPTPATVAPIVRGPPGSSKGRSIAAARLLGELDPVGKP